VVIFGTPLFFMVALVAIIVDKRCDSARKALVISSIAFVLWLIFVIGGLL